MYSISGEHPSHGSKSLKLELYPSDRPDYPGLTPIIRENNWSDFKALSFDIYNPEGNNVVSRDLKNRRQKRLPGV